MTEVITNFFKTDKESKKVTGSSFLGNSNTEQLLKDTPTILNFTSENEVIRLGFPSEIDESQKPKTLNLIILKQQSWEDLEKLQSAVMGLISENDNRATEKSKREKGNNPQDTKTETKEENQLLKEVKELISKGVKSLDEILRQISNKFTNIDLSNPSNWSSSQVEAIIQLPIPNNMMEQEQHNYTGAKFDDSKLVEGITTQYGELEKLINSGAQSASQMFNMNRRTSRPMPQMPTLNPFLYQKYESSETKEYGFTFFLVPRSRQEAEQCMKISYLLKKYSYPRKTKLKLDGSDVNLTDAFVVPPNKVLMKFNNPMLQKLISPGVCVIKSCQTTYNEGTTVGMTIDGIPRFIEIQLTLTEYNQKFQEDF